MTKMTSLALWTIEDASVHRGVVGLSLCVGHNRKYGAYRFRSDSVSLRAPARKGEATLTACGKDLEYQTCGHCLFTWQWAVTVLEISE